MAPGSAVLPGAGMFEAHCEAKRKINDSIDKLLIIIKKLRLTSPAFVAIAKGAPTWKKPVVRQRAYLHMFEWVKKKASTSSGAEQIDAVMPTLERVVMDGLTDVWSATRKATAEKLHGFACYLSLDQLERIFECILERYSQAECESAEVASGGGAKEQWREKEGCILGINAVIRQFVKMQQGDGSGGDRFVQLQSQTFPCLPNFVTGRLPALLFGALAHPQVSVRETASKTFASYLQRSGMSESVACLERVKDKLSGGDGSVPASSSPTGHAVPDDEPGAGIKRITEAAPVEGAARGTSWHKYTNWKSIGKGILSQKIILVEAYEAQGLLSLCEYLFKTLPSAHILGQWPVLFPTINMYLAHSASTVRQSCSNLFLIIVAKSDQQSPILQRLVLQSMSTSKANLSNSCDSDALENRRLFDEQDVAGMFGARGRTSSEGTCARPGVPAECEQVSEEELWHSWEWHEGRLLAYELLLGHLVKDHMGNMFNSDPGHTSPKSQGNSPVPYRSPIPPDSQFDARLSGGSPHPQSRHFQDSALSPMPANSASLMSILSSPSPSRSRSNFDTSIPSLLDRLSDASDCMSGNIQTIEGRFVGTFEFEPLGAVLTRMFHEVLNGVVDVRWELRRMALQVLPLLTVAALWHDVDLVEKLWRKWLPVAGSPAFVAALSIKEAIVKSLEYSQFPISSPSTVTTHERVIAMSHRIFRFLPEALPAIGRLTCSQNSWRVCALGVELIIIIHCKLPSVAAAVQQEQVSTVATWLESLFSAAHESGRHSSFDRFHHKPPSLRSPTIIIIFVLNFD